MSVKSSGIHRSTQPKLFPEYGIGIGYIIILIIRLFSDITPRLYKLFYIGSHYVTLADILLVTGLLAGVVMWLIKR